MVSWRYFSNNCPIKKLKSSNSCQRFSQIQIRVQQPQYTVPNVRQYNQQQQQQQVSIQSIRFSHFQSFNRLINIFPRPTKLLKYHLFFHSTQLQYQPQYQQQNIQYNRPQTPAKQTLAIQRKPQIPQYQRDPEEQEDEQDDVSQAPIHSLILSRDNIYNL